MYVRAQSFEREREMVFLTLECVSQIKSRVNN